VNCGVDEDGDGYACMVVVRGHLKKEKRRAENGDGGKGEGWMLGVRVASLGFMEPK